MNRAQQHLGPHGGNVKPRNAEVFVPKLVSESNDDLRNGRSRARDAASISCHAEAGAHGQILSRRFSDQHQPATERCFPTTGSRWAHLHEHHSEGHGRGGQSPAQEVGLTRVARASGPRLVQHLWGNEDERANPHRQIERVTRPRIDRTDPKRAIDLNSCAVCLAHHTVDPHLPDAPAERSHQSGGELIYQRAAELHAAEAGG